MGNFLRKRTETERMGTLQSTVNETERMGNSQSTIEKADQEKASDFHEIWRDDGLGSWNEAAVLKLRGDVTECLRDLKPRRNIDFLVCGACGAGKSSFVNNCMTSLSGEVCYLAKAGPAEQHITKWFQIFQSYTYENGQVKTFPLQFCDTKGIVSDTDIAPVAACILGKVKNKEEMTTRNDREWEERLPVRNKVSYIFFVVDIFVGDLQDDLKRHFLYLRNLAIKEEIPVAIILTKCDRVDARVDLNVSNLQCSESVKKRVQYFSSLLDIQENRVFPVKNYTKELNASSEMMIQTLLALRTCLRDIRSQELAKVETISDLSL